MTGRGAVIAYGTNGQPLYEENDMTKPKLKKDPVGERIRRAKEARKDILRVTEKGIESVEKPSPEILPEALRQLPADRVTKDIDDNDKAHASDPEHIINAVKTDERMQEQAAKRGESPAEKLAGLLKPSMEYMPLSQFNVDFVRWRVQLQLLDRCADEAMQGKHLNTDAVFWLWFPENDLRVYELRVGPPPSGASLPKHLRLLKLDIRPFSLPPPAVRDMMQVYGVEIPKVQNLLDDLKSAHARRKADREWLKSQQKKIVETTTGLTVGDITGKREP